MVAIAPLRAVRYDPARVDPATVTSPPYDVLSVAQRDAYLAGDPNSIVHVILGANQAGDQPFPASPNKYERARAHLEQWLSEGVMVRDGRPAFYAYEIRYEAPGGGVRTMKGFFARIALDPTYTQIRRHEATHKKARGDRLDLKEATRCDTEPIQLLYRDERGWVDEVLQSNAFDELLRFQDEQGFEQRLWRVDRPEALGEIVAQFEDREVVIADGHHRYQTALDHYANTGRDEDGSILVVLVRDTDSGIRIDPTHRLVTGLPYAILEEALAPLGAHWDVRILPNADAASVRASVGDNDRAVAVVGKDATGRVQAAVLELKPDGDVDEGRGRLDRLAVTRIHDRLLRDGWGIGPDDVEDKVQYTRVDDEAVDAVSEGRCQFALVLPPTPVDAVLDVARAGHVMPQKSTYFIPKMRSGLILSPLDEPLPRNWQELAGEPGPPPKFVLPPLE